MMGPLHQSHPHRHIRVHIHIANREIDENYGDKNGKYFSNTPGRIASTTMSNNNNDNFDWKWKNENE